MVQYFWSAIAEKGDTIQLSGELKAKGHIRSEEASEKFRKKFADERLGKNKLHTNVIK